MTPPGRMFLEEFKSDFDFEPATKELKRAVSSRRCENGVNDFDINTDRG